jgi:UDP-N-acetylglucosamine diphosphorylase/glucosamine-1-phosphate N-acetyltransferase
MNVVVFEDAAVAQLGDLIAARPACDLTLGSHTLVEALGHIGHVRRAVRPHLAAHLAGLGGRLAVWGGMADSGWQPPASRHGVIVLLVNARVVPSRENLLALRGLVEAGHRGAVRHAGSIAAAIVHLAADASGPVHAVVERLLASGHDAVATIESLALPEAVAELALVAAPHDIVTAHERALAGSLALRIDSGAYQEIRADLFVAAGGHVADAVVVRNGPVVVEAGAEIGPFVCLDGPVWIGPGARVNPHAWLRAGTAVGRGCRVGGEVEASVLEPFSNKAHEGFLGHSHLGSWVNLGAGTITSNLKTSYGPIRLHEPRRDGGTDAIDTGRQFLGALIGDFTKTAIHSSLPCGCRIGPAATVGGSVPEVVPGFSTMLGSGAGGSRATVEQVTTVLGRMMARRGLEILPADRDLVQAIAGGGVPAAG